MAHSGITFRQNFVKISQLVLNFKAGHLQRQCGNLISLLLPLRKKYVKSRGNLEVRGNCDSLHDVRSSLES
jgi:hypothetical protein